jgi:hypothetical protein
MDHSLMAHPGQLAAELLLGFFVSGASFRGMDGGDSGQQQHGCFGA